MLLYIIDYTVFSKFNYTFDDVCFKRDYFDIVSLILELELNKK